MKKELLRDALDYIQKAVIVQACFRLNSIHSADSQFKERVRFREFPAHTLIYRKDKKLRTEGAVTNLNRRDTHRHSHSRERSRGKNAGGTSRGWPRDSNILAATGSCGSNLSLLPPHLAKGSPPLLLTPYDLRFAPTPPHTV